MEWYFAGMRTLGFVLFSSQYRTVQDRKLTFLIWLARTSSASFVVVFFVLATSGLLQRH